MPNEIDHLMNLDPLELSAQDIEALVTYYRKARQNHEAGIKPKKDTGPKVALDLTAMGLIPKAPTIRRRI
jgi:hypothetical protein